VVEAAEEGGKPILRVTLPDSILGIKLAIDADTLALAAAVIPAAGTKEMADLFKVTLSPDELLPAGS
jgi:heterodisulfide reductase subunit A